MRCPTCRAPWRESRECPRCGSDLTPLMRTAAAAHDHREAALRALDTGHWHEAFDHASTAARLHRTDRGTAVLWIARVMAWGRE